MEYVDVVFYINLEHRTDRRAHIEKTIQKLCNDPLKVVRIDAVYTKENGALGCAMSHLDALNKFRTNPAWKTCIILEDDFEFLNNDISQNNYKLRQIIENCPDWDAISLTYTPDSLLYENMEKDNIIKVIFHSSTAGYMLKKGELLEELIYCFRKSALNLEKMNANIGSLNIDQTWRYIQSKYNWYSTIAPLGKFIDGYSDISKKNICFKEWDIFKPTV
jgi:GR25 family glycosyltransferase involved in LPS biosynthesis